jgi:hypothetical protein
MFSDQAVKTYSGGKPNYTQPIGWLNPNEKEHDGYAFSFKRAGVFTLPLYPVPQKEWVGFTQEEHQAAIWTDGSYGAGFLHAEKLLKEKNGN